MISEWFFSYYDTTFIQESARFIILTGMVTFVIILIYNLIDDQGWSASLFLGISFGLIATVLSAAAVMLLPGILGTIFWAMFL